MIKVFLADTISICNEINKMIKWEKEGFNLVGEAYDGEMALPLIREVKPDILIVDSSLSIINGYQLSKLIMQEMPWIKVIIASNCHDFYMIKEAMNIGITHYLNKPVEYDELLNALKRIQKQIHDGLSNAMNEDTIYSCLQNNTKFKVQKLFGEFVSHDNVSLNSILESCKKMNIDLVAKQYNTILCQISLKDKMISHYNYDINETIKKLSNHMQGDSNIIVCNLFHGITAFLVKGADHDEIVTNTKEIVQKIQKILQKTPNMDYFIAVGSEVNRLSELGQSINSVMKTFTYRHFVKRNQIFYYENTKEYRLIKDKSINLKNVKFNKSSINIIEKYLRTGIKEEAEYVLKIYMGIFGKELNDSLLLRQYMILDIYFLCVSIMENHGYIGEVLIDDCGDPQDMSFANNSMEEVITYLTKLLQTVVEYREMSSAKKYSNFLIKAKEYIDENYSKKALSLQNVANLVNISPSYFSTIFSQETGQNFIDYLTSIRMEKAKELLLSSDMKSSEIGYAIGYNDPHYFSYIFKKNLGVTPKDYRASRK